MKMDSPTILFDGVCNLCNSSVQKIITRDTKGFFKYASLQSSFGQEFLKENKLPTETFDSFIVLFPNGTFYTESDAFLKVLENLQGIYLALAQLLALIPKGLRNTIYKYVAKNRYKWFGKRETCMLPKAEWKSRFIN